MSDFVINENFAEDNCYQSIAKLIELVLTGIIKKLMPSLEDLQNQGNPSGQGGQGGYGSQPQPNYPDMPYNDPHFDPGFVEDDYGEVNPFHYGDDDLFPGGIGRPNGGSWMGPNHPGFGQQGGPLYIGGGKRGYVLCSQPILTQQTQIPTRSA